MLNNMNTPLFIKIKDFIFAVDEIQYVKLNEVNIQVMLRKGYLVCVTIESKSEGMLLYSKICEQLQYISNSALKLGNKNDE